MPPGGGPRGPRAEPGAAGAPAVFAGGLGIVAAYPATGGAPLWTFPAAKTVNAPPAVLNGVVYFAPTRPLVLRRHLAEHHLHHRQGGQLLSFAPSGAKR
jgi:hypothetical protein